MIKREKLLRVFIGLLLIILVLSFIGDNLTLKNTNYNKNNDLNLSSSLEGIENVVITRVVRQVNISGYGTLIFEDTLDVKNLNNNPISSIFICLPSYDYEDLTFFQAKGINQNTLLAERTNMKMNDFEMIIVYFDSPLLPHQTKTILFKYIYKDVLSYYTIDKQYVGFLMNVFPLLPYKLDGEITTNIKIPEGAEDVINDWGQYLPEAYRIVFRFDYIKLEIGAFYVSPFLENLGDRKIVQISFSDNIRTNIEMNEINREIFISPWGILRIREEFSVHNLGDIDAYTLSLRVPKDARNIYISDFLGEIQGISFLDIEIYNYKRADIELMENRVRLTPNSTYSFNVEYYLPFEKYISMNWFQQSIQIDLLTTTFEYLGRDQTTKIIIEGCYTISSITDPPDAIQKSKGTTIIIYRADIVNPTETKVIQLTFTLDIFELILRPIAFILIISVIASIFVLLIKTRKKERDITIIETKFIPVNEIREFCSLTEEKNALILEIRQAEEDSKRKKMAKKKYKNILDKNTAKIEEIQKEVMSFKKALIEAGETFESVIKRLDVLDAERSSIQDSLSLLESRYKRGRLPSRAAYIKLSNDFKKRRKKIDRTIDRYIQQLRSYLL